MLFILLIAFALPSYSSTKVEVFRYPLELDITPLCLLDIEMRDGCDGEQKCRCPPNSVCKVTAVEDRLSVCKPTEAKPVCHPVDGQEILLLCDTSCVCPDGYTCLERPEMSPKCLIDEAVTEQPETTPKPICEGIGRNCIYQCTCPVGKLCTTHPSAGPACRDIGTTVKPPFTELPMLECGVNDFLCDIGCVCPFGTFCIIDHESRHCEDFLIEPLTAEQPSTTLAPEVEPMCLEQTGEIPTCDDCYCPDGYYCHYVFYSLRITCSLKENEVTQEPETPEPELPTCEFLNFRNCDTECLCPENDRCRHFAYFNECEPKGLEICTDDNNFRCNHECVCPTGEHCSVSPEGSNCDPADEPIPLEPTKPAEVDAFCMGDLFRCGFSCHCPEGYDCIDSIVDVLPPRCQLQTEPTVQQQCRLGGDCSGCTCAEGQYCDYDVIFGNYCMPKEEQYTELPMLECGVNDFLCDIGCVCPFGTFCSGDHDSRHCEGFLSEATTKPAVDTTTKALIVDQICEPLNLLHQLMELEQCSSECYCPQGYKCFFGTSCLLSENKDSTTEAAVVTTSLAGAVDPICVDGDDVGLDLGLEQCGGYQCYCPRGYRCYEFPWHYGKQCMLIHQELSAPTAVVTTAQADTVNPICREVDIGFGYDVYLCGFGCYCPEGYECSAPPSALVIHQAQCVVSAKEPSTTEAAVETTEPQIINPICGQIDLGFVLDTEVCGFGCYCPEDYICNGPPEAKIIHKCLFWREEEEPASPLPTCSRRFENCETSCACPTETKCKWWPKGGFSCDPLRFCGSLMQPDARCGIDCKCPEGQGCAFQMVFPPDASKDRSFCAPKETTTQYVPFTMIFPPLCDGTVPASNCETQCRCPEGKVCRDGACKEIYELVTPPEIPVCKLDYPKHVDPAIYCPQLCYCPENYHCEYSGRCEKDVPKQTVIEKVDELADEAVDLAAQQLDKVQEIHEVIEGEEEEEEEEEERLIQLFKQFA